MASQLYLSHDVCLEVNPSFINDCHTALQLTGTKKDCCKERIVTHVELATYYDSLGEYSGAFEEKNAPLQFCPHMLLNMLLLAVHLEKNETRRGDFL